jgi:hypothetical protein
VEGDLMYEIILEHASKVIKVKQFLRMCILRYKHQKKIKAIPKIQSLFRMKIARKRTKNLKTAQRDQSNLSKLSILIHKSDTDKLNSAAIKI